MAAMFPLRKLHSKSSSMSVSDTDSEWSGPGSNNFVSMLPSSESQALMLEHHDKSFKDGKFKSWQPLKHRISALQSQLPTGWRLGTWVATAEAAFVLLINVIIAIWALIRTRGQTNGVIYEGNCTTVDHANVAIHLVINILSTLLLGASNYVMQSLSAPTRLEIEKAHKNNQWLDIGIQSLRNIGHTSRWKKFTWIFLSFSSIPLHLFYNSSFFSVVGAYEYAIFIASGPQINNISSYSTYNWECGPSGCPWIIKQTEFSNWQYLSVSDCISAYATDFLSKQRNLVLVANYTNNGTVEIIPSGYENFGGQLGPFTSPFSWICSGINSTEASTCPAQLWTKINSSNWTIPFGRGSAIQLKYCISEPVEPTCQLSFSLPLLILVILFNAVKVGCMSRVAMKMTDFPLVTLGDAIATFIKSPDLHVKSKCLISKHYYEKRDYNHLRFGTPPPPFDIPLPIKYQPEQIKWREIAGTQLWISTIILFSTAIAVVVGLLGYAVSKLQSNFGEHGISALWQLGLATAHSENIIQGWAIPSQGNIALLLSTIVANSPQIILSILYFSFNSLCTKLFLALEWSSYVHSRKSLRVSHPSGSQRSTYFLQIPFLYGFLLLVCSAVLHWLISQCIFLVAVNYLNNPLVVQSNGSIITCGYSPVGMIFAVIFGSILLLTAIVIHNFRSLSGDMPLVGSCSAAIAAACHPPEGDSELEPLKWGVIPALSSGEFGHISFSSGKVTKPIPGHRYA